MIGDRIRQARLAAALTLEDVAERLSAAGHPITRAGLSKYEKNEYAPAPSALIMLGKALRVRPAFFLSDYSFEIQWSAFRRQTRLTKRKQQQIQEAAKGIAEKQLRLQLILYPDKRPDIPKQQPVKKINDAENVAAALRKAWKLGLGPIESLTQAVEDQGCIVVGITENINGFDGLSGWANAKFPVLAINMTIPTDRRRYTIAHELGHIVMDCRDLPENEKEEDYAHRFAAAFLVPPENAYLELGEKRRSLNIAELGLLKQKYGLSMQGWIRRALDLGIIQERQYNTFYKLFSSRGWRKNEPYSFFGYEQPTRLRQMTLHALEEGIIPPDNAEEICPGIVAESAPVVGATSKAHLSAAELLRLPVRLRNEIIEKAAAKAEEEYRTNRGLTDFEAFGREDLHDETK
jgi:Zn-dependent peptidase ImmA (M78 family)